MKHTLLFCLACLAVTSFTNADQTATFPQKEPLIDLTFPDGWEIKEEGALLAHPKEDQSFIVSVAPLESTNDKVSEAVAEVKKLIEEDFEDVTYEELQKIEGEGVVSLLLQAKGKDSDGKASIFNLIINQPKAESLLLLQMIASSEGFEKYAEAGKQLMLSVKAHATVQTFAYPNKKEPAFTVDFPADWKLQTTDEGAYVESPDKLIPFNVLLIDSADVGVALESMKKKVGGAYSEIVWNEGKEANVVKDDALSLTATFENGQAMDGKDPYVVNFVQYVKKGSDKFLLMFTQYPKAALEKHADNLEAVIKSIKVR